MELVTLTAKPKIKSTDKVKVICSCEKVFYDGELSGLLDLFTNKSKWFSSKLQKDLNAHLKETGHTAKIVRNDGMVIRFTLIIAIPKPNVRFNT